MSLVIQHYDKWLATVPAYVLSDLSKQAQEDPVVVRLGDGFNIDAVRDVCEALLESGTARAAARQPVVTRYIDMVQMRTVCHALGVDFDRWIRPSFFTHGAIELCTFQVVAYGVVGCLQFDYGRVHIKYRSPRIVLNTTCDYTVHGNGFMLRTRNKVFLEVDDNDLVMHFYGDHSNEVQRLCNVTPQRLAVAVPPAVPQYNVDELKLVE